MHVLIVTLFFLFSVAPIAKAGNSSSHIYKNCLLQNTSLNEYLNTEFIKNNAHLDQQTLEEMNLYAHSLQLIRNDEPVPAICLLKNLTDNGHYYAAEKLGLLYLYGYGVPHDKEKAKHLFRFRVSNVFQSTKTAKNCDKSAKRAIRQIKQKRDGVDHPLYKEQIHWWQNLCHQPSGELYKLPIGT